MNVADVVAAGATRIAVVRAIGDADEPERAARTLEMRWAAGSAGCCPLRQLVFVPMERNWLARELERGRSIAAIAREVGCHPATVGYWVNKHRLMSHHATRHAARGGMDEARLRSLVERGLSIREIAGECGLSPRPFGTGSVNSGCVRSPLAMHRAAAGTRSCANAMCTAGRRSVASAQAATVARSVFTRVSRAAAAGLRRSSWPRQAEHVCCVATTGSVGHCSSTTSIPARNASRSRGAASRARSRKPARRPESACYCARTATRRWKADTVPRRHLWQNNRPVRGSSTAERSAVNRRVVGSNPTPGACERRPNGASRRPAANRLLVRVQLGGHEAPARAERFFDLTPAIRAVLPRTNLDSRLQTY